MMTRDEEESVMKVCSKFFQIGAKFKHVDEKKFKEFLMTLHRFTADRGLLLPGLFVLKTVTVVGNLN